MLWYLLSFLFFPLFFQLGRPWEISRLCGDPCILDRAWNHLHATSHARAQTPVCPGGSSQAGWVPWEGCRRGRRGCSRQGPCSGERWQGGACTSDGDGLGTALLLVTSDHPCLSHHPLLTQVLASRACREVGTHLTGFARASFLGAPLPGAALSLEHICPWEQRLEHQLLFPASGSSAWDLPPSPAPGESGCEQQVLTPSPHHRTSSGTRPWSRRGGGTMLPRARRHPSRGTREAKP